jgi:Mg2+/Co2+ transporter CorB
MNLDDEDVDTVAGVLMSRAQKLPEVGDRIEFGDATAEILEVKGDHAELIRIVTHDPMTGSSVARKDAGADRNSDTNANGKQDGARE